jgi:hypothetical protein
MRRPRPSLSKPISGTTSEWPARRFCLDCAARHVSHQDRLGPRQCLQLRCNPKCFGSDYSPAARRLSPPRATLANTCAQLRVRRAVLKGKRASTCPIYGVDTPVSTRAYRLVTGLLLSHCPTLMRSKKKARCIRCCNGLGLTSGIRSAILVFVSERATLSINR